MECYDRSVLMADNELDLRRLNCPMPIIQTQKALRHMSSGEILSVVATDPGSIRDFPAFAYQTGHTLLEASEEGGEFRFRIRKG